jgi:uncharacterized protein (TIGR03790 family)
MIASLGLLLAGAVGLGPADILLIVNRNEPASADVAAHYVQQRGVPADQVVTLDLPTSETISRADYDAKLAGPLREALRERRETVKVLLSVYGVPLRVGRSLPDAAEKADLDKLNAELMPLREQVKALKAKPDADDAAKKSLAEIERQVRGLELRIRWLNHAESEASVDSELMLLWWPAYELRRWQPNLLYFQVPLSARAGKPPILYTARLDGPTPAIAKGLVDKAIATEKTGLKGRVYVDARGIRFDPKKGQDTGHGYGGYDESMREMARLLETEAKLPVTLDDQPALFASGSCPDCALYCGWYSHAKYVDSCTFVPGAVGWHLASSEAVSLRNPKATYWCKRMLEEGITATVGPVAEPYTIGFPKPAEFFGMLVTGQRTLVECYAHTQLFCSWMGVLVGDPLYRPFAADPRMPLEKVRPSPAGGRPPFAGRSERSGG